MTYAMYVRHQVNQFTYSLAQVGFGKTEIAMTINFLYCPLLFFIGNAYGTSLSFFLINNCLFRILYNFNYKK